MDDDNDDDFDDGGNSHTWKPKTRIQFLKPYYCQNLI